MTGPGAPGLAGIGYAAGEDPFAGEGGEALERAELLAIGRGAGRAAERTAQGGTPAVRGRKGGQASTRALPELARAVASFLRAHPSGGPEDFEAELRKSDPWKFYGEELSVGEVEVRYGKRSRMVEGIRADSNPAHPGVAWSALPGYFRRARHGSARASR